MFMNYPDGMHKLVSGDCSVVGVKVMADPSDGAMPWRNCWHSRRSMPTASEYFSTACTTADRKGP